MEVITQQLIFFVRLVLACICGGLIGYERTNRGKGAGIRTHIIVALASALMMIVSKYGFTDMVKYGAMKVTDGSRIAAQVVTGVGFLGAGMIYFNRHHSVKGLTTAAGIWATSGVGLALGAGMYTMGIITSVLIVTMQTILHRNSKILSMANEDIMVAEIADSKESVEYLKNMLSEHGITITSVKAEKTDCQRMLVKMDINVPTDIEYSTFMEILNESDSIYALDIKCAD